MSAGGSGRKTAVWSGCQSSVIFRCEAVSLGLSRILHTCQGGVASRLSHICEPREPKTTQKENDMKWFFIGLFVAVGILDVLLILGCAKLERIHEKNERDNRKIQ